MNKIMFAVLSILDKAGVTLGSGDIALHLGRQGNRLSERTIRYYLKKLDEKGFTVTDGKKGRRITALGRQELKHGHVSERVGFIINMINNLSFLSDFGPDNVRGKAVLNVSLVPEEKLRHAIETLGIVLRSPYSMSDRVIIVKAGQRLGNILVPEHMAAIGTLCSITMNGMFLKCGIPISTRLGGLVEVMDGRPVRFTQVISYEGSSVPPLEIFIKSRMTDVLGALMGGTGFILGSYREIPENSLADAKDVLARMARLGFGGIILFGQPGQSLLGVPATVGKVGLVVLGGLNVNAALEETGVSSSSQAMATLCEYPMLSSIESLEKVYFPERSSSPHFIKKYFMRSREEKDDGYWSVFRALKQTTT